MESNGNIPSMKGKKVTVGGKRLTGYSRKKKKGGEAEGRKGEHKMHEGKRCAPLMTGKG